MLFPKSFEYFLREYLGGQQILLCFWMDFQFLLPKLSLSWDLVLTREIYTLYLWAFERKRMLDKSLCFSVLLVIFVLAFKFYFPFSLNNFN